MISCLRMARYRLLSRLAGNLQCQISRSKQSREIVANAETQNIFPRCEPDGHVHGQLLLAHPFVGRLRERCLRGLHFRLHQLAFGSERLYLKLANCSGESFPIQPEGFPIQFDGFPIQSGGFPIQSEGFRIQSETTAWRDLSQIQPLCPNPAAEAVPEP